MGIKRAEKLRACDEDQIGVSIPKPLNARLDVLAERATEAGENTSRKEIVAALILNSPESGAALSKLVRRYRLAVAGDAAVGDEDESRFLEPAPSRPGPRGRKR
jgi:hypothetical protein